ncbi:amino acid adenylation domain-containing protein [Streptomyces sp. CoH27]|uniref:non-ribosomal peptide synthetase n=1 Tax=Streptomyces sp. CoH27 TaxID=2875763 RepID=UPI001CD5394F|nr:amino acid adenylation domain-containing protein [Streptomyces sp. CoH27]
MSDTRTGAGPAVLPPAALSPIQRAYLVGEQPGMELRGPARYYLGCDLDPARVPGLGDRLRRLLRANAVLRAGVADDLSLPVPPETAADTADVGIHHVDDADFDTADAGVRAAFTADTFTFPEGPRLLVTVVTSGHRARLHLTYALWLMDAASLEVFLAALISDGTPDEPANGVAHRTAERVVPASGDGLAPADRRAPDSGDRPRTAESGAGRTGAAPGEQAPAGGAGRDRSARDRRFWAERAAGQAGPAEVPLRPEWRRAGPGVGHRTVTVAPATARVVVDAAREHGLTPALCYLAVYGVVLGLTGGGVPHTLTVLYSRRAGHRPAPDGLGNHGTTMPLEIPATAGRDFAEIARTVQRRYLAQALHGSLSGAEIARLADPGGDPRRLPYPFAFTALETDGRREAGLGFRRRWDEVRLRVPQVLLDHQVVLDADGTVRLGFDWRTDAFDAGFVEDLIGQYSGLIDELAGSREHWTRLPHRTPVPVPAPPLASVAPGDTLHGRVLRRAAETPDAPAVHDEQGTLRYAELTAHAAAAADALRAAGARPGDRVAVHLPRGRGQVIAMLGSLLAGCVYIPLDHGLPDGRLDSIARRGEVRFAFCPDPAADGWGRRGARPLRLPVPAAVPSAPPARAPVTRPVSTAYIIFTSGSTGEPKGVVISHSAVLTTIDAVNDELGVGAGDRVLSVSSIGFDLSVYDIFGPLLRGGAVVLLSERSARTPAAWAELIGRHGVTIWNSAPALASLLAEEATAVPTVRTFMLSGDWIPLTLPAALWGLAPAAEIMSLGGATEGAIWSIRHRVEEADCAGRSIPYGTALPGQDIHVLDADRRTCPDWHIGEICIGGAGVADGYADDPVKTAAAFVEDPVLGRLYRTGDRGRRHPDGVVEFLGRTDTQVKLNGHRVELGEVEHLLDRSPGIRGSAVCVRGEGRRARLVAYVTLTEDATQTWRRDAYAALGTALPHYMVPDAVIALDEIPLTGNGKVDRRRLRSLPLPEGADPDETHPERAAALPVADPLGREIAGCWQEVLGRLPGPESLFDAGGSSYDAIRLLSLVRGRLGHEVSFGDFMANPTVAGLAALCRRARGAHGSGIWTYRPRTAVRPRLRLVLFPPVGGGVSCYARLVGELPGDVDVHAAGLDGPVPQAGPAASLTGLARGCLRELPAEVLSGAQALVFAGWSFGGALAYEAARICGVPVARVVVVDTPVSAASRAHGDLSEGALLDGFRRDIRETSGADVRRADVAADPALRTRFEVYRQNIAALAAWSPRPAALPVVEFRAGDRPAERDAGAWARLAPIAGTAVLPGGHFDVFRPDNARRIAAAVTAGPAEANGTTVNGTTADVTTADATDLRVTP